MDIGEGGTVWAAVWHPPVPGNPKRPDLIVTAWSGRRPLS